ncbi:MAG TPA: hypothetical protein VGT08_00750 [Terracidiphilus sp.]|nr:hypothetical protein [Terracidiphilus sp.]
MNRLQFIYFWALAAAFACISCTASAQQSFYGRLRSNNASMTAVQPTWMGPLIQADGRLGQAVRFSVSNANFCGTRTLNYGNGKGIAMIVDRRFQIDLDPPAYFRNHSSTMKDGFGNAGTQLKYRIASGNAQHGNYAVSAVLYHAFAPRVYQNLMLTSFYAPSIAAGKAFGRFAVLQNVGGFLPTGKIAQQGRAVEWNSTAQMHLSKYAWVDVEDNATFFRGGPFDGKAQNFVTPAAFYMIRRNEWKPEHASVVFAAGMQIATSNFHYYNHNLVTEMRVVF